MSGEAGDYQITRSLRFNSADSAYLNRTPASAGNRQTWTWSAWVKRGRLGTSTTGLFGAGSGGTTDTGIYWTSGDKIDFFDRSGGSLTGYITTNAVFRDPSAWYHIVVVFDSTNATSANRMQIYVNNVLQSVTVNNTLTQNTQGVVNNTVSHAVGSLTGGSNVGDGYLADIYFIDGTALTPSSFGETDTDTGVWKPKQYTGSYGTNGFNLKFADNSGTTSTTLGKDSSSNGNNWTPNNFSVTAGAGNDSLVDTPTPYGTDTGVGGEVRGNYATLNPLKKHSNATLSNGNLSVASAGANNYATGISTISPSSGNYYMEMLLSGSNTSRPWGIGLVSTTAAADVGVSSTGTFYVTNGSGSTVVYYVNSSVAATLSTTTTWEAGDIISLAWNVDSGKFWVGRNGVWYPSSTGGTVASNSDVAAGNYATFTISYANNTDPKVVPAFTTYGTLGPTVDVNFGQRPFAYTAPSGFKALCTQNLPTPTVVQGDDYFNTVLYTGTGATRSVTGVGFQPDWVWIKSRSVGTYHHRLTDAVRGVTKELYSNLTNAEGTDPNGLTAFGSDGFTLGSSNEYNFSGATFVAWNWNAGGSTVTNTAGSISSQVRANTTSGFSIVTYTGTGANATVGHGLGVAPRMIIIKSRSDVSGWAVYQADVGNTKYLRLDGTDAANTASTLWNNTSPTSSVFSVGTDGWVNTSPRTYVAYCFAPVAGFSAFGSYTGNGSADGPFVYLGFRPAFVLIKQSSASGEHWTILDDQRNTSNVVNKELYANLANAEGSNAGNATLDFTSNGFKIRTTNAGQNTSSATYIYAAFASNPFKFSLGA
jgi:hypothetical protein